MVVSTTKKATAFLEFMRQRIARIVPLYWLALGVAAIGIKWSTGTAPEAAEILKAYLFIFYTNPRNGLLAPFLVPGWSLNYEMFFYLLFGATLFITGWRQIAAIGLCFVGLVAMRPFVGHYGAFAFRMTSPLLFEFLSGCIIGMMLPHINRLSVRLGTSLVIGGLIVGLLFHRWAPHAPRTIGFGLPAVLLVMGAICCEPIFRSRSMKPALILGDASYSIYLTHPFALDFLLPSLNPLAQIVFAAAFSVVCYFTIERPLNSIARGILLPSRKSASYCTP
jgi:exopolysaccharide production protein ExoZ